MDLNAVDRAVSDVDPLAAGQRRVETAQTLTQPRLYLFNQDARWGEVGLPTLDYATGLMRTRTYYYEAPGVRAWMDRPEYLIPTGRDRFQRNIAPLQDGTYIGVIAPNTIFDLIPERPVIYRDLEEIYNDVARSYQVDTQYRVRMDQRLEQQQRPTAQGADIPRPDYLPRDTPEHLIIEAMRRRQRENQSSPLVPQPRPAAEEKPVEAEEKTEPDTSKNADQAP